MMWFCMNGYNMRPPRPPPKGIMWTEACDQCGSRLHRGVEASATWAGKGVRKTTCNKCTAEKHQGRSIEQMLG